MNPQQSHFSGWLALVLSGRAPQAPQNEASPFWVWAGCVHGSENALVSGYIRMGPMLNQSQAGEIQPTVPLDTPGDLYATRGTILVVEDEAFVREPTCDILEDEGYLVLRAGNATQAESAFHRQHGNVHLLLSDVVLPDQNGPMLAKSLRVVRPSLLAIFISGYHEKALTRYGLTAGETSYLPKPFSAESLLGKVKQVLESGQEQACS